MNNEQVIKMMRYYYSIASIPIRILENGVITSRFPELEDALDPALHYIKDALKDTSTISYIVTKSGASYGFVALTDAYHLVLGPVYTTVPSKDMILTEMQESEISTTHLQKFTIFINSIPYRLHSSFIATLSFLHFSFTQDYIGIEQIDTNTQIDSPSKDVDTQYAQTNYESRENEVVHTTYHHELHLMSLIASGNVEKVQEFVSSPPVGKQGKVASTPLRQSKNIFVSSATLYTRAAVSGGLGIEEAYNLSDLYIRKSETLESEHEVRKLERQMALDFTTRVARDTIYKGVTQPIVDAIRYIKVHVNQPVQAQDVAESVGLSTSYFLKRFKNEVGIGVSEYITKIKIEEAKLLLSYTDKPLTEISNYLYFSSQSYFQNVFKKITGLTPGAYRNQKISLPFL